MKCKWLVILLLTIGHHLFFWVAAWEAVGGNHYKDAIDPAPGLETISTQIVSVLQFPLCPLMPCSDWLARHFEEVYLLNSLLWGVGLYVLLAWVLRRHRANKAGVAEETYFGPLLPQGLE